jgi:GPH family glycoside/pentoside/hexuronide:cation symporter
MKNKLTEITIAYSSPSHKSSVKIKTSSTAFEVLLAHWNNELLKLQEEFKILLLNQSNHVLGVYEASRGGVSDYSELKTGHRATGLIFSSSSMSQKLGWTIGGAISGWILAAYGFVANEVQTDESIMGIRLMISVFAAIGALISVAIMYYYPLTEKFMKEEVAVQLEEARAKNK